MSTMRQGELFSVEKTEEMAAVLQSSVLNPLENTIGILRQGWTGDAASEIFCRRLDLHRENIQEICRQLREAVLQMEGQQQ